MSRIEVDGVELAFFGGGPVVLAAPEGSEPGDLVGVEHHEKTISASGIYLPPPHRRPILCSESIQVLVRHDRPIGGLPSADNDATHRVGVTVLGAPDVRIHAPILLGVANRAAIDRRPRARGRRSPLRGKRHDTWPGL